eukprot:12998033-Alexandrium_andersonii.AAC.1
MVFWQGVGRDGSDIILVPRLVGRVHGAALRLRDVAWQCFAGGRAPARLSWLEGSSCARMCGVDVVVG